MREAYQQVSGDRVDGERWLMYRLAELWRLGKAGDLDAFDVQQRSAAAVHDYLAELYLRDLLPGTGPLCAIDLDGVLECGAAWLPGDLTDRDACPAHADRARLPARTGHRTLDARGSRPVPGLRPGGGVSEYGAALYHDGETVDLRPSASSVLLDQIRRQLSGHADVTLDPRYRYAVRARRGNGPLPTEILAEIRAIGGTDVEIHPGDGQTDIVPAEIDKGTGLRALAGLMADPGCALAVGDALPDLPLLACAQLARAPRNANFDGAGVGLSVRGTAIRQAWPRPAET